MTNQEHLEISRKLALAIGWKPEQITEYCGTCWVADPVRQRDVEFDYRDEVIAFRVAEQFDCFPYRNFEGRWTTQLMDCYAEVAETPQLAIALAVIAAQGVK